MSRYTMSRLVILGGLTAVCLFSHGCGDTTSQPDDSTCTLPKPGALTSPDDDLPPVRCPTCQGRGSETITEFREEWRNSFCYECSGTGKVDRRRGIGPDARKERVTCQACGGVGRKRSTFPDRRSVDKTITCRTCNGAQFVSLNSAGQPTQDHGAVTVKPSADAFVQAISVSPRSTAGALLDIQVVLGLRGDASISAVGVIEVRGQVTPYGANLVSRGDYPLGDSAFRGLRSGSPQTLTIRIPGDRLAPGTWEIYAIVDAANLRDGSNNTSSSIIVPFGR